MKEGDEVKLLYDDIGCMATLAGNYTKRLRKMGIDAHKLNKVIPVAAYNTETTVKILAADGHDRLYRVSIWQTSTSTIERFGHWKDSAVRLDELLRP